MKNLSRCQDLSIKGYLDLIIERVLCRRNDGYRSEAGWSLCYVCAPHTFLCSTFRVLEKAYQKTWKTTN